MTIPVFDDPDEARRQGIVRMREWMATQKQPRWVGEYISKMLHTRAVINRLMIVFIARKSD